MSARRLVLTAAAAVLLATSAAAQNERSARVYREDQPLTEEQVRIQQLQRQISELQGELREARLRLPTAPDIPAGESPARLAAAEQEFSTYLAEVERLAPLESRIRSLQRQVGVAADRRQRITRDRVRGLLEGVRRRLNLARRAEQEETGRERAHTASLAELDRQLSDIDAQLAGLRSSRNDATVGGVGDFLANLDRQSEGDFLEQMDRELAREGAESDPASGAGWLITSRGGQNGVVDRDGETLVPFRDWTITEYRDGIARVERIVARKECGGSGTNYPYWWQIVEIGFVARSGAYLDDPIRTSRSGGGGSKLYIIATPQYDTAEERRAAERRAEQARRERALELRRCKLEGEQWASERI